MITHDEWWEAHYKGTASKRGLTEEMLTICKAYSRCGWESSQEALRARIDEPQAMTAASIVADLEAGRLSNLEAFKHLAPLTDGKGVTP
jgi:hypothetical protein